MTFASCPRSMTWIEATPASFVTRVSGTAWESQSSSGWLLVFRKSRTAIRRWAAGEGAGPAENESRAQDKDPNQDPLHTSIPMSDVF